MNKSITEPTLRSTFKHELVSIIDPVNNQTARPTIRPIVSMTENSLLLLLIITLHFLAFLIAIWISPKVIQEMTMPTIQGVFVSMPAAEVVQQPSKQTKPVTPSAVNLETLLKGKANSKSESKAKPTVKSNAESNVKPTVKPSKQLKTESKEKQPPAIAVPPTLSTDENKHQGVVLVPPTLDANPHNNPAPAYPKLSRRLKEQGKVLLEILILPDGSVSKVRLKQSSGFERLDKTAIKAIKRWRFIPATKAGVAISYWYLQPLEFNLK